MAWEIAERATFEIVLDHRVPEDPEKLNWQATVFFPNTGGLHVYGRSRGDALRAIIEMMSPLLQKHVSNGS